MDTSGAFCWKCGVPLATGREPFIPAHPPAPEEPEPESLTVRMVSHSGRIAGSARTAPAENARGKRPVVATVLLLLAAAVLVSSLFVSWYATSESVSTTILDSHFTVNGTASFYPLDHVSVSLTCTGSVYCFGNTTRTGSYSQSNLTSLGSLYDVVSGLVIGSVVLVVGAVAVALITGTKGTRWAVVLVLLAVILAGIAPALLFADQPSVIKSNGSSSTGPGPGNSFVGSCSGTGCGGSNISGSNDHASWGPSLGWYLPFLALAPLVLGFFSVRGRRAASPGASFYGANY